MRIVKLIVSDFKDLTEFYRKHNLIMDNRGFAQVRPGNVFISKEDAERFRRELYKKAKKEMNSTRSIEMAVGMEWLNLGPNETLSQGIRPGYALIIEEDSLEQFNKDLEELMDEA